LIGFVGVGAMVDECRGTDRVWTPQNQNNRFWNSAANWNPTGVPVSGDNVYLASSCDFDGTYNAGGGLNQVVIHDSDLSQDSSISRMNTDREVITGYLGGHFQHAGQTSINVLLIDGNMPLEGFGPMAYGLGGGSLTTNAGLNYISVGSSANRYGYFGLHGTGTLLTSEFNVGYFGNGTFEQTGGSADFRGNTGGFRVGVQPGSGGAADISGGTTITDVIHVGGSAIGVGGTGILNISGGRTTVTGTLKIHNTFGSKFTLSGGVLAPGAIDISGNTNLFD